MSELDRERRTINRFSGLDQTYKICPHPYISGKTKNYYLSDNTFDALVQYVKKHLWHYLTDIVPNGAPFKKPEIECKIVPSGSAEPTTDAGYLNIGVRKNVIMGYKIPMHRSCRDMPAQPTPVT